MKNFVIRLREVGPLVNYFGEANFQLNDYVILEAERGLDYGQIIEIIEIQNILNESAEIKQILRKVSGEEWETIKKNQEEAKKAISICEEKIIQHKLKMKIIDAEYSFDKKKIIFYFVAEKRIDFRELVKDLAKIFKIRIEMRQIGVRDEAKFFGGIGPCGEILCCVRFLKSFEPVTTKMAKIQKLPLNIEKISGICGRLMCCLVYEYKDYKELSKGLPKEGQIIETEKGKAKVINVNILKRLVYIEFENGNVEKIFYPESKEEGE